MPTHITARLARHNDGWNGAVSPFRSLEPRLMPALTNKAWFSAIAASAKRVRLSAILPPRFVDDDREIHSRFMATLSARSQAICKLAIFACFLLALHSSPAAAWNRAGNLYGYCKALVKEWDKGGQISECANNCNSYFQGVGDALIRSGQPGQNKCMADHYLNLDDLNNMKIFVNYMDKHPEKQDDIASDVIRQSLEEVCNQ